MSGRRYSNAPTYRYATLLPRQPLANRQHRWERFVRFNLIPVGRARHVVGAVVGVAVLDRHLEALAEVDRVFDVEAVVGRLAAPVGPCPAVLARDRGCRTLRRDNRRC
jgi:hypothetical protein